LKRSREHQDCARPSIRRWSTLDGHLHLQYGRAAAGADQGLGGPGLEARFRHNILPAILGKYKMHAYNFVDENKQRGALLARCGHAGGLLRRQYGCGLGLADVQPLRQELADAHAGAAVSAGEVCLWRAGPHRHGDQLDHLGGVHRLRRGGAQQRALAGCARQLVSDVDSSIIFSHVNIGRHCRIATRSSTAMCRFPTGR
jgi:glucose-1-phosphate adenylyltransferase